MGPLVLLKIFEGVFSVGMSISSNSRVITDILGVQKLRNIMLKHQCYLNSLKPILNLNKLSELYHLCHLDASTFIFGNKFSILFHFPHIGLYFFP